MKFYCILYQFLMLYFVKQTASESYYSIVAPGLMKSNRKYTVAVTLHDADEPSSIRISIEGPSFTKAEEVFLRPFESKLLDFLPPKLMSGDYKITAESLSGFQFKNESKLYIESNNGPKIYIQTDKAVYRPNDLVQFRVVILDEHTKPLNIREPIRIEIMDELDNRVKQFKDITLVKGVYTDKFQLSEQPVLGTWKIKVSISGKYAYSSWKTIKVQKYVLPKFSVFLKAPSDIVAEDGYLKAIIFGKYTFDKYVMGSATIEIWNINKTAVLQQKKLDIDSLGFVEFNLENVKDFKKQYGIYLKVKLTEKYTGITQEEEKFIILRKQRYDIRIPYDQIETRNYKPYRLKAYIKYWTGAEVLDRETPVIMEHGGIKYETYLDDNGVATFEFEHQQDAKHIITYKDSRETLSSIFVDESLMVNDNEYYCKLKLLDTKTNPNTQLTLNIPDTITTWRITAFSNNEVTGFGIVDEPTDITTIQPFFISLNLPYSVKRGEIVEIPITLFNYLNQSLDTEVIMYNNDEEFYFMESTIHGAEKAQDNQQQIKNVNVPSDEGKSLSFLINPKQLGDINIRISASNSLYSDAVQHILKVESEGVAKQHNQAKYISALGDELLSLSFSVEIPPDSVPNSEYITLTVGGDYMVPAIENLNELVQMPTGCGEQNMINFAPNILVLEYLKATGKFPKEKELIKKIRSNMDLGYQQQLSFRYTNGGYSVFGEKSDGEASTWLTAYVVRFFIKASKYSSIEARIIDMGLDYLAKQQQGNGKFPNTGYLLQPAHKNEYGFTAFILLAFLEDRKIAMKYQTTIQNALQFINSNLDEVNDIYALSIIANALIMAKHNSAKRVLEKLQTYNKTNDNGHIWWSGNDKNRAKDIEITGYVLMALLNTPGDHMPIFKWLIEQRNVQGGFKSTHDTVVGLQALVRFAQKYNNPQNMNMRITYGAKDTQGNDVQIGNLAVNTDNVAFLQKRELPKSTRSVILDISGTGNFLFQLSQQYNFINEEEFKHFLIKPKANIINSYEINLEICFTYQSLRGSADVTTNMVIIEANLPSGYRSDAESSFDLIDNELIQRIESKNDESVIILYIDNLSANMNHCLNIAADKTNDVLMRKPAAIIMYDYYNISRSNTEFYNILM